MPLQRYEIQIPGSNGRPVTMDITFGNEHGKCPAIIYAHGFNGFKDWGNFDLIAQQFAAAGFTFVKFNFSHNGTSPGHLQDFVDLEAFGNNNYTKELFDLDQVIAWLSDPDNAFSEQIDAARIGLIGHSMGGGISILKTAEDNRIKALATWASIAHCKTPWGSWPADKMQRWKASGTEYYVNGRTRQQMPLHYQLYLDYKGHTDRLDILQASSRIKVPFLICHGTGDTSVNIDNAYAIQAASPSSELYVVSSDHVFGRKHPWTDPSLPDAMQQVVSKNIDFFRKNLMR